MEYLSGNKIETITYNKGIDEAELHICEKDRILQYYMVSTDYNGGKKAIKKKLLPIIKKDRISFETKNGNITIRFIVNCNGEIGLFRAKSINENFEQTNFDKTKIEYLISLVSSLDDWVPGAYTDKKYDSYYFINFKVRKGLITDIF